MQPGIYAALVSYLAALDEATATLSFARIEGILCHPLPACARVQPCCWSIYGGRSAGGALLAAGWWAFLDAERQVVVFRRIEADDGSGASRR